MQAFRDEVSEEADRPIVRRRIAPRLVDAYRNIR